MAGSQVMLEIQCEQQLQDGWIAFSDGREQKLKLSGATELSGSVGRAQFTVERSEQYTVHLVNVLGFAGEPTSYDIVPIDDHPPVAQFVEPVGEIDVPIDAQVTVKAQATDDFGLQDIAVVQLRYAADTDGEQSVTLVERARQSLPERDRT